jgi:hypothetical protein
VHLGNLGCSLGIKWLLKPIPFEDGLIVAEHLVERNIGGSILVQALKDCNGVLGEFRLM